MANTGNTWDHEGDVPAAGSGGGVFGHHAAADMAERGTGTPPAPHGRRGTP
ncbi:hypothetical protein [Streptomyces flaveolus]|uniref:hypothetical protein n=1 Tax=Streptomyces flaveolus TaxID=67297 RepID=UPI0036AC7DA6